MNLDDAALYNRLDPQNMRSSIELLPDQIQQTYGEINALTTSQDYRHVTSIVFSGMGGSALGAQVTKHLYGPTLPVPFEIVNDYHLPSYVDSKTLVYIQSYSGTTYESISCLQDAHGKHSKIFVVAVGGELIEKAGELNVPFFKINPVNNPSNQPRMGVGYSVSMLIAFLHKLGFISLESEEIEQVVDFLKKSNQLYGTQVLETNNPAKQLARVLFGKIPLFFSGEYLTGAIHANRNQFNENAKSLSIYYNLPEGDHYVLEAFQYPPQILKQIMCIFYTGSYLSENLIRRIKATDEVIKQAGIDTKTINFDGPSKLGEIIQAIHFGAYVGFYTAMLNGIDPSPIPHVENFKSMMKS